MQALGLTAKNMAIIREMMDSEEMQTAVMTIPRETLRKIFSGEEVDA